jgi:hypothetical protein
MNQQEGCCNEENIFEMDCDAFVAVAPCRSNFESQLWRCLFGCSFSYEKVSA